ncbi:hypothetical protein AJ78_06505 [Emergomyces pasteurianus Ep9510]|uniref:Uncharacterized protein n=1 Tax=Emergomyces pasteurianus Ep9510 TaxID=1447872 RepID=A0A1J9PAA4_9EURO|nr:hypothetical protein AJ78_06505 [Emergomyces pasteurianus Ep9510]
MRLTTLSLFARFGVLSSSAIVLSLGVKFIQNRASSMEFLLYIEVLSALTILGSMIPPYPNFVYDLVWTLAWTVAGAFAMVIQFFESDCYGFRSDGKIGCATYKASTAFSFLCMIAWLTSMLLGGFRILDAVFDIRSVTNRLVNVEVGSREQEENGKQQEREREGLNETVDDLPSGERQKKTKKVKGFGNSHIASHLACYCIIGVVLNVAGLSTLFIWAAPAFGRYIIYQTPIPDYTITLSNPIDNNISFTITSNIRVPDRFKVSVDPIHADFFLNDRRSYTAPVMTVDLPKLSFRSNERIELVNQTLKFGKPDEFARLIQQIMYQPAFSIFGRARANLQLPPIPATRIDIDGAVELSGFDNFAQIDIREVGVQPRNEEGYNVVVEMVLVNPSPVSVTLGDMALRVLVGGIQVGRAFVAFKGIVPGNNTLFVKGILDYGNVQKNIVSILKTEAPYLKEGLIMASAVVDSVVHQGGHLNYWEKSLQSLEVSVTTPVKPLLNSLRGKSIELVPDGLTDGGGIGRDALSSLAEVVLKTIKIMASL